MDVRRLLKVYNYVNDERRPKVNLKFVSVYAAFLLSGAALVTFLAVSQRDHAEAPGTGTNADVAGASQTAYVGLSESEIASGVLDTSLVENRLDDWRTAHPDAEIEKQVPQKVGSLVVGYWLTYREP